MVALLRARDVEEEKFLMVQNGSLINSLKVVDSAADLADKGQVNSVAAHIKIQKSNQEYQQEQTLQTEKLAIEKTKAVEQLETDLAVVAQASERIKANAESFVNSGKDAWNNHYEKTEAELREKSDSSSNHVQGIIPTEAIFWLNSSLKIMCTWFIRLF